MTPIERTDSASQRQPASFGAVAALAAAVFVVGYGLDQLTKYFVVTRMELGEQIWVIPGLLKWYSIRNSGAAFSMGENFTWVFTLFMAAVAIGVLIYLPRVRSRLWALALGGLFAGTVGNLTDRLFQPPGKGLGHVVDFISVGNFAIFNIADSLIVCSVISVVLLLWTAVPPSGGPRVREDKGTADAAAAGDGSKPNSTQLAQEQPAELKAAGDAEHAERKHRHSAEAGE